MCILFKFTTFEFWSVYNMKKILIPLILIAIMVAIYEQSLPQKNVWIMAVCIAIGMFGLMYLSSKTPSKNQDKNDDDVQ